MDGKIWSLETDGIGCKGTRERERERERELRGSEEDDDDATIIFCPYLSLADASYICL
jgi:hypothetical protein